MRLRGFYINPELYGALTVSPLYGSHAAPLYLAFSFKPLQVLRTVLVIVRWSGKERIAENSWRLS